MKVTIVTVCYNAAKTIADCVASVQAQQGVDIEHIIIDGGSSDGTLQRLAPFRERISVVVSERDNGIYDAMNKGLARATSDITGFLNADDLFAGPTVLARLMNAYNAAETDVVFGDVDQINYSGRVVRRFRGDCFRPDRITSGIMPPHPATYIKTDLMRRAGGFDASYRVGGDFDMVLRLFLLHNARWAYLPETIVRMRIGGASTSGLKSYMQISRDMMRSCAAHDAQANKLAIYGRILHKSIEVFDALRPGQSHG